MFGLFKSKKQKLNAKYKKLLKEAFGLSTINRRQSDLKYAEADAVMNEIEKLS